MNKLPVALIGFNRPDLIKNVLSAIGAYRPSRMYLIADGPRPGVSNDLKLCNETREAMEKGISWPCETNHVFAEGNLGCRRRVVSGLDAVFEKEEKAIILEDDTVPTPDFFEFCQTMLERYKEDRSIYSVTGTNIAPWLSPNKPFLCRFSHIWGWGTWRRSWKVYERDLSLLENPEYPQILERVLGNQRSTRAWMERFATVKSGSLDAWGYGVQATLWAQGSFCLTSPRNLVKNVGFRDDATHTRGRDCLFASMDTAGLSNITGEVVKSSIAYEWYFENVFHGDSRFARMVMYGLARLRRLTGR
jgi:hypothetical protein